MNENSEINIDSRVLEYIDSSISKNTARAYQSDWADFNKFCKYKGYQSLPAKYETIGEYLVYCADTLNLKPSTISRRIAAIVRTHRDNKHPLDTKHKYIRPTLQGIKRKKGSRQVGSKALLTEDIKKIINATNVDDIRSLRDKSLILLGFIGAFRRSELVNIDCEDIEENIEGLIVHIKASKTDQEALGRKVGIPYSKNQFYCPVKSLRRWMEAASINKGPLYRKINKSNNIQEKKLSDRAVALIIKNAVINAKLDPSRYAGHSLRSGFATSSAFAGADEKEIMKTTGHKSVQMVHRYIQDANLFKNNAAKKLDL
ncbi:MAG: Tyrosine recombinase XerD [Alphaproteobacteria bacterium MarineAlpha5_Bin11]|nr:integrase [Pelagibacteraceae bacterium]PPR43800.1 MAG: Tyrosine recombinase XerD [Alphaproteobacteria bacterium MarineAlpha5_Bin11]|tara:strand:- start:486 stop:1430 length:945 start_codon:yes stop_codon:yes gene_type:complete